MQGHSLIPYENKEVKVVREEIRQKQEGEIQEMV